MKVYRVVEYDGMESWIKATLVHSIQGVYRTGLGTVTATIVEGISPENEEALDLVRGSDWRREDEGKDD